MVKRVMCPKCGAICEYDDKSVWEGNRDFEDVECQICGYKGVFTPHQMIEHAKNHEGK